MLRCLHVDFSTSKAQLVRTYDRPFVLKRSGYDCRSSVLYSMMYSVSSGVFIFLLKI
jgi:hypothetical protein